MEGPLFKAEKRTNINAECEQENEESSSSSNSTATTLTLDDSIATTSLNALDENTTDEHNPQNPQHTHLRVCRSSCWSNKFVVSHLLTGKEYYICKEKRLTWSRTRTICDCNKQQLFSMKGKYVGLSSKHQYLYKGGSSITPDQPALLDIKSAFDVHSIRIVGTSSGNCSENLVLKVASDNKSTMLYRGQTTRSKAPVAKIQVVAGRGVFSAPEYHLTISAGIEEALVVAMCLSFDESMRDYRRLL